MKRSHERILSAGLIHMSLMHPGCEDVLMQGNKLKGRTNLGSNSKGARKPERTSPPGSTQSLHEIDQRPTILYRRERRWQQSRTLRYNFSINVLLLCPAPRPEPVGHGRGKLDMGGVKVAQAVLLSWTGHNDCLCGSSRSPPTERSVRQPLHGIGQGNYQLNDQQPHRLQVHRQGQGDSQYIYIYISLVVGVILQYLLQCYCWCCTNNGYSML